MQVQKPISPSPQNGGLEQVKEQQTYSISTRTFPYLRLMWNPSERIQRLVTHCNEIFQAVTFIQKFAGICEEALGQNVKKLAECLEQPKNMWTHQKTLFIDIDETLLTRTSVPVKGSETIQIGAHQIYFKVRPFAIQFLKQMSRYYDLILFSASQEIYSRSFFQYFNERTQNSIRQYLSRDYCIQAYKNIYIKDLRVVRSRNLKDTILLDNSVFSFGVLIQNGVPIMSYDCSDTDRELQFLTEYLIEASFADDVRQFNKQRLKLREITSQGRGK